MKKGKKAQQAKRKAIATKRSAKAKKRHNGTHSKAMEIPSMPQLLRRPDSYTGFAQVVEYAKSYVYLIARVRPKSNNQVRFATLGTGFLVGPNRFMTCCHCIDDPSNKTNPLAHHEDGDMYLFVQRDENGNTHTATVLPKLNKDIFCKPETDSAIIYLPDDFYKYRGRYVKNPGNHLRLCGKPRNIGVDVGVLGYPLQGLSIADNGQPDISKIFIRGDKGVVNTRYHRADGIYMYEFTMAFNPGNSGGPIFDNKTGDVIGMVHAFNSIPLRPVEDTITMKNGDGIAEKIKHTSIIRTNYSLGLASDNFKQYKDSHLIAFDE